MITEPVTLSEVAIEGSKRVLNLTDDYSIEFPDAPALASRTYLARYEKDRGRRTS